MNDFGGPGSLCGASWKKGQKSDLFLLRNFSHLEAIFEILWQKYGGENWSVFGTLFFPLKRPPAPPRRSIVEPRAPKKLPKWSPKSTLLRTSGTSNFAAIY